MTSLSRNNYSLTTLAILKIFFLFKSVASIYLHIYFLFKIYHLVSLYLTLWRFGLSCIRRPNSIKQLFYLSETEISWLGKQVRSFMLIVSFCTYFVLFSPNILSSTLLVLPTPVVSGVGVAEFTDWQLLCRLGTNTIRRHQWLLHGIISEVFFIFTLTAFSTVANTS